MPSPRRTPVPFRERHVHPFVAWTAIISFSAISVLPSIIFADESIPVPPAVADVDSCALKCESAMRSCMADAAGTDSTFRCQTAAGQCLSACKPPEQPPQPPVAPPAPPDCKATCISTNADCVAKAGDDTALATQCQQTLSTCTDSCPKDDQPPADQMEPTDSPTAPTAQTSEADQQHLEAMQKHAAVFVKQLNGVKKRIAALEAKGYSAPAELDSTIALAETAAAEITGASDVTAAESAATSLSGYAKTISDLVRDMGRLANLPAVYAKIDKQLAQLDKQLVQDRAIASHLSIDDSGALDSLATEISAVKDAYQAAKADLTSGNQTDGLAALQTNVINALIKLSFSQRSLDQIQRMPATLLLSGRELAGYQKQLDHLSAKGVDVTSARAILADATAQLEVIKSVAPSATTAAELFDDLQALAEKKFEFTQELAVLRGSPNVGLLDYKVNAPVFDTPDAAAPNPFSPPQQPPTPPPTQPPTQQ